MGKFTMIETEIDGVYVISPKIFEGSNDYFIEAYNKRDFQEAGFFNEFLQDNQLHSTKGVLRGLHYAKKFSQTCIVRAIKGAVYYVTVDLRYCSKTFGKYYGMIISENNLKQLIIPRNFAHGFLVLTNTAEILCKCDIPNHPETANGIIWNDPKIAINWPLEMIGGIENLIVSTIDSNWPTFDQLIADK